MKYTEVERFEMYVKSMKRTRDLVQQGLIERAESAIRELKLEIFHARLAAEGIEPDDVRAVVKRK